ncbi:MAG: hypothetical protein ACRESV_05290 [Nevskiales bacterium]
MRHAAVAVQKWVYPRQAVVRSSSGYQPKLSDNAFSGFCIAQSTSL